MAQVFVLFPIQVIKQLTHFPTSNFETQPGGSNHAAEYAFIVLSHCNSPVRATVGAGAVSAYDHKDVLEVGTDVFGGKGEGSGFLEHNGNNVVPNVSLP